MRRIVKSRIRGWSTDRLVHLALAHGAAPRGRAAIAVLQSRGTPGMLARIEALLRSTSVRRRVLGLEIAAQLRAPGHAHDYQADPFAPGTTQAMFVDSLADRDPRVVRSAIAGLGHQPLPAALPALLAHLRHPDLRVRFALAYTLGSYPGPEATSALMHLAIDRDDLVREWATFGIGTLSEADDDAVRTLLWANAHDPYRDVRGEAVVGLARRSDPRVIELLKTRLLDDDCRVYELEAAEEMPSAELLEPLQRLRDDAEQRRDLDPFWHRHLLEAIDACATVADATA